MKKHNRKISVIGLGYVGLPVAVAFGRQEIIVGFDIKEDRIEQLKKGVDITGEVEKEKLLSADIFFTSDPEDIKKANFHIIAVPTPINESKQPDLTPLFKASETAGKVLKKGDIIVYESTVYPGATEEECVPILERFSGLKSGIDFKVGYSPERINPGDKKHSFTKIKKIVSGQDKESCRIIEKVYDSVLEAGVYRAPSIKVAEAAKIIENTQRDLNIALMNELSIIFNIMNIETSQVLKAAETKWNFLPFRPGLVGGHCIGVDPYYLTHKAEKMGYTPEVILSGRRINDGMGKFIADKTVKDMIKKGHNISKSIVTILGLTFKENCPDIRNSKVVDIIKELEDFGIKIQVNDPYADSKECEDEYGVSLTGFEKLKPASAVVIAVAHDEYEKLSSNSFNLLLKDNGVVIDVKSLRDSKEITDAGFGYWSL